MGKATNLVAGMWMNMECHGFDLNPRNIDRTQDVLDQHFPNGTFHLYNEDGVDMKPLQNEEESFDAIITDPPYLNCPDLYTQEENDLSNMSQSQWEQMMAITFRHYHRLIKRSRVKDKVFYPLMMTMTNDPTEEAWTEGMKDAIKKYKPTKHNPIESGEFHPVIMKMNATRRAEGGMTSMDFILSRIAEEEGFTLWDRTFNMLAPSSVSVSVLRNYDFYYTAKNWETTLIWIKQ